jgi:hypothetical protein
MYRRGLERKQVSDNLRNFGILGMSLCPSSRCHLAIHVAFPARRVADGWINATNKRWIDVRVGRRYNSLSSSLIRTWDSIMQPSKTLACARPL